MAFDLSFMQTQCNHIKYDEPLFDVNQTSYAALYAGSYYGEAVYGQDTVCGQDYYAPSFGNVTQMGEINGVTYAIFTPQTTLGSGVRLFYKNPTDYQRIEVPKQGKVYISTDLVCGILEMGSDSQNDSSATTAIIPLFKVNYSSSPLTFSIPDPAVSFVIPPNSILILTFDITKQWFIDYAVPQTDCPYCSGSGVTNDISFGSIGLLSLVYNNDKLAQTVTRGAVFERGNNPYFPTYGTNLQGMIGSKNMQNAWLLRGELYDFLKNLKSFQNYIDTTNPGFLSPGEILENILEITIQQLDGGMHLKFNFVLLCRAMTQVKTKALSITL